MTAPVVPKGSRIRIAGKVAIWTVTQQNGYMLNIKNGNGTRKRIQLPYPGFEIVSLPATQQ